MHLIQFILYVRDQQASAAFYEKVLRRKPVLNVQGMTEFALNDSCKLGIMPSSGIVKILQDKTPDPSSGHGIPRCEIYLYVDDVGAEFKHALAAGAKEVSAPADRDWGDHAAYLADSDGHILVFAKPITSNRNLTTT